MSRDFVSHFQSADKNEPRFDGARMLLEAVYWQAIKDVIAEWRWAEKHGEHKYSNDYRSAVNFLNSSGKGQRIMRILKSLDDEQRAKLISMGLTILNGNEWGKE